MSEEKLILDNIPLIYKCIKDMHCFWNTEDEFQDLYDAGLEGLIRGAKVYDETKGIKPSTFLYPCIKNMITRKFQLSEYQKRKIHKETMISLDGCIKDDTETTYLEMLEDPNVNIEEEVLKKLESEKLIYAIDKVLDEDHKRILYKQYGLCGYTQMTLEEIAQEEKCSRNNIYQKNQFSKRRLKKYLEKNKGEVFMEEYRLRGGLKKCNNCKKIKPIEEFNFKTDEKKYRKQYCKDCEEKHNNMFQNVFISEPVNVKSIEVSPKVKLGKNTIYHNETGIAIVPDDVNSIESETSKINNIILRKDELLHNVTELEEQLKDITQMIESRKIELDTLKWVIEQLDL